MCKIQKLQYKEYLSKSLACESLTDNVATESVFQLKLASKRDLSSKHIADR